MGIHATYNMHMDEPNHFHYYYSTIACKMNKKFVAINMLSEFLFTFKVDVLCPNIKLFLHYAQTFNLSVYTTVLLLRCCASLIMLRERCTLFPTRCCKN